MTGLFDFRSTVGDSRLYTFHSHTEFCDGRAQMEAFARAAFAAGFTHYGFTPHSPVPIVSSCNMTKGHVADYTCEFERIKAEHGQQVKFYRGMEIDYLGSDWNPSIQYFVDLDLDFSIGSVHFIPTRKGEQVDIDGRYENFRRKMHEYFDDDIRYVVETFYAKSMEMLSHGGFDIIGHYDKIGHNAAHYREGIEEERWYVDLRDTLTDEIIKSGVTVEINTKALAEHHRFFPNQAVWSKLVANNVPIIINSDAHVPALINAGRPEAFSILDKISHAG